MAPAGVVPYRACGASAGCCGERQRYSDCLGGSKLAGQTRASSNRNWTCRWLTGFCDYLVQPRDSSKSIV